jgi:hypothetical protein
MNRYGRHAPAAFDAKVGASLPRLDTAEGLQDAAKVLGRHDVRILDALLNCLAR